jgi:hypothetical protein
MTLADFFQRSPNYYCSPTVCGISLNAIIAFLIASAILLTVFVSNHYPRYSVSLKRMAWGMIWLIVILYTALQTAGQFISCHNIIATFAGKPDTVRDQRMYGDPYLFARKVRQAFPRGCSAVLLTDLDAADDFVLFEEGALSYFLYPVDTGKDSSKPEKCLVVFKKKNAMTFVPENYRVLVKDGTDSLFAVKDP